MKTISTLAAAAVFLSGVSGLAIVAPAVAKDKKDDAKAPAMKLSPAVIKVAKPAQDAIVAKDLTTAEPLVVQLEAAATTPDDKYIAAVLRYNLESQKLYAQQQANPNAPLNETTLSAPLDALIASPSTPAADRGRYAFRRGSLAFNSQQYPVALQYYAKARELGYNDENLGLQIVKAKFESGDTAGGAAELDKTIATMNAAGQKAPEEYYRYAIARSNRAKLKPETMRWLRKYVAAYPSGKNWRDVLVTFGLQQNAVVTLDNRQKIDLFRLMRASGALGDQYDYLEYAQKVQGVGLPVEAQTVLKEGLASGKIPAANTEAKAMLGEAAKAIGNEGPLAGLEKKASASTDGKLAEQTGDAYLGQATYAKAVELYRVALQKGGVDADVVNTHLGIALARAGDKAGATEAFAAVKAAPRSDVASLWSTWVNAPAA